MIVAKLRDMNDANEQHSDPPKLLSMAEVAGICGVAVATVAGWRYHKIGPPAIKLPGVVRYRQTDVIDWLDSCKEHGDDPS